MAYGRPRSKRNWRPGTVHQVYCTRCGSDQVGWATFNGKYVMVWVESARVYGGVIPHLDVRHDCWDFERGGRPCSPPDLIGADGVCSREAHQSPEQRRIKKAAHEANMKRINAQRAAERKAWRQREQGS